jgi:hypothetical protein
VATRADALTALEKVLARLGPAGRAATITLGELVDEYLEIHQAEPVTDRRPPPYHRRTDLPVIATGCNHGAP